MARIAYYVHGRGRGHAARSRPILAALAAAGHELHVRAGGATAEGLAGPWELREIASILPGPRALFSGMARGVSDLGELRRLAPDLVITDGDAPALHAARWAGIPTIAVGHGLYFDRCRLPPGLPRASVIFERLNAGSSSWGADQAVAVHFLPFEARAPRTHLARPDMDPLLAEKAPREGFLLAYFRDGNGASWVERAAALGAPVVCYGRLDRVPRGVETRPADRAGFARDLVRCRGILGSAGSNLLAEAVLTQTPVLALHGRRDHEQRLNAILVERAGVGVAGCLDRPPGEEIERWFGSLGVRPSRSVDLAQALRPASEVVLVLVTQAVSAASQHVRFHK
jgi:hypothetical protein